MERSERKKRGFYVRCVGECGIDYDLGTVKILIKDAFPQFKKDNLIVWKPNNLKDDEFMCQQCTNYCEPYGHEFKVNPFKFELTAIKTLEEII